MVRVTSETMVSGSQLYSYLEIDGRGTNATASYYDLRGGVTSGFYWDLTCSSFLKWWENGSGHDIDSGSGYYGGYSDLQLVSSDSFAVTRTSSDRYITFECYSTSSLGSGSARYTVEVPHLPGAPTNLTATRISDNRIDLSWTNPTLPYGGFYLQVSIDGGSWSNAWSVENVMPTSYSYTAASAGHSYKFRAYTGHWYAYSAYSNETAIITMTPAAPQSISVAASGGTNVTVTLANDSAVATSLEYQTSTDGGSTWSASTTVSGSPVTSFSTSVSGTALIRVRNKNATGVSAWLVSDPITTICPPAPPTLRTPSGSVYDMAQGDIEFSWLHNSLDGSSQTAYQLRYARNGGAWTTLSGTTAQSRTVSLGTFSAGDSVTWQVRTKGADANYSDWSTSGVFNVYTAPTLSITSPGATITGMPISLTATYSDMAGFTCQAAAVSLTKDGRTLFSEAANISGNSITASLTTDEFLPTNGESYTVVLTARSSSSLQTSASATFLVDFTEPVEGTLQMQNDPETGYVSLVAEYDNTDADEPAVSISVARVSADGTITPLLTDGESGSGIVDRYAPLNTAYRYAVTTKAASQAVSTVYFENKIETPRWFAYWGENIAWARWNPKGGTTITRPEKKRVHYVGRTYPVSYDSLAIDQQNTLKVTALLDEWSDGFADLMRDGGRGVYKGADGSVFWADFEYSTSADYASATRIDEVSLTITRIDGEKL